MTDYCDIAEGEGELFAVLNEISSFVDGPLNLCWRSSEEGEDWCGECDCTDVEAASDFIREQLIANEDHYDFLFKSGKVASLDRNLFKDQNREYYYIIYEEVETA